MRKKKQNKKTKAKSKQNKKTNRKVIKYLMLIIPDARHQIRF